MILAGDGKLYGATSSGGANGSGTLYRLTPPSTLEVFYSFDTDHGTSPYDDLALSVSTERSSERRMPGGPTISGRSIV